MMMNDLHVCNACKKNCYNVFESYGEICVHCGCCSKDPEERYRARLELHKRLLFEDENFTGWDEDPEVLKIQKENQAANIKWNTAQIRKYERSLNRVVPKCCYCKKPLGLIDERDGKRYCFSCHYRMNADGSPAEETREWLKGGQNDQY